MASKNDRSVSVSESKRAFDVVDKAREEVRKLGDALKARDKKRIIDSVLTVLPTIRSSHNGKDKTVRGLLRSLGHYISDRGYSTSYLDAEIAKEGKATQRKATQRKATQRKATPAVETPAVETPAVETPAVA